MNEDIEPQSPPDEDRTPAQDSSTAAAQPAKEWVMPEPVFRRSDGFDPRERPMAVPPVPQSEIDTDIPDAPDVPPVPVTEVEEQLPEPPEEAAPTASDHDADEGDDPLPPISVVVAEQPDLSGDFKLDEIETPPAAGKKGTGVLRIVLIVLALAGMLAVLFVFLALVYLLFFFPSGESQNLN
jgi:hypothetical protein